MFNTISSLFELNTKISDFMEYENFTKYVIIGVFPVISCFRTLAAVHSLLDMLIANSNVLLSIRFTDEDENLKVPPFLII